MIEAIILLLAATILWFISQIQVQNLDEKEYKDEQL